MSTITMATSEVGTTTNNDDDDDDDHEEEDKEDNDGPGAALGADALDGAQFIRGCRSENEDNGDAGDDAAVSTLAGPVVISRVNRKCSASSSRSASTVSSR